VRLGIDREQHRRPQAPPRREDLRELRQALLGAVLLVARDQHDVLAAIGLLRRLERQPRLWFGGGRTGEADEADENECGVEHAARS
jgi:hypothetical protein